MSWSSSEQCTRTRAVTALIVARTRIPRAEREEPSLAKQKAFPCPQSPLQCIEIGSS